MDADDARRMLEGLSGRVHHVSTGVCVMLLSPAADVESTTSFVETTDVEFYPLTSDEIRAYAAEHPEALARVAVDPRVGIDAAKAVEIVDVIIALTVSFAFFGRIHIVEPKIRDDFTCDVVHKTGMAIADVGVRVDAPIGF